MAFENIADTATDYLKKHKRAFLDRYLKGYESQSPKIAIFTAGASGAGKTEYAISRKSKEPYLLHLDIDGVREFFSPIGYDGTNSDEYQKPSSKGVNWLFDRASKRGFSFILDTNFAEITMAQSNIERLISKSYTIEIVYIFREVEKSFEFTKKREAITKRRVPKEVVYRSFKDSFTTTLLIKELFRESVVLSLINREDDTIYENISSDYFFQLLSKRFTP